MPLSKALCVKGQLASNMGEIKSHEVAGVFNSYLKHIRQKLLFLRQPNKTLPVCYCLYSFEGALCNKHWNEIGEEKKEKFKKNIGT